MSYLISLFGYRCVYHDISMRKWCSRRPLWVS